MAESLTALQELKEFRKLIWGPTIKPDVFKRWSQGFEFSEIEPSALVQRHGGPCAILAPVQAFLIKILMKDGPTPNLNKLTADKCKFLLVQALCNILKKCSDSNYRIVTLPDHCEEAIENTMVQEHTGCLSPEDKSEYSPEEFHDRLAILNVDSIAQVEKYYSDNFHTLNGQYGVLLFMYTVNLTRTLQNVIDEVVDTSEPLIHDVYGYGSQALINLMLTGRAVAHVWDNDQDIGGLKLRGITQQSDIGFITLMEQMRYITVGSFYKNPKNPIWVMGSETHLTVLFSFEQRLVSPETPCESAKRVFKSYDPEGNNFIPSAVLQDVLYALGLVSDPEYVDIMAKKLDPENLGIILLNAFMDEFFPEETRSVPDSFTLMHYNGIPGSNIQGKVKYCEGNAILLESDLRAMSSSDPMLTCLQTKWPNIEVNWPDCRPSLN